MTSSIMTKRAIADALMTLAGKRSIDKITVKDIAEACFITRQTFYYHFRDILDVFEWILEEKLEKMIVETQQMEQPGEAIRLMLSISIENGEVINRLMGSQYREDVERIFLASIQKYLWEMIDRRKLFQHVTRSDLEMAVKLHSYAMTGLLFEISRDPDPDLDSMTQQLCRLLSGEMLNPDAGQ